jgi:hypothetical protein
MELVPFFVSSYKDLAPMEPFFGSLFRLLRAKGASGDLGAGGPNVRFSYSLSNRWRPRH